MPERLYTEHPELYDAVQSGWDYDRDVQFLHEALERHDGDGNRLLELGCGTGEHTRRLVASGHDVTAIDKHAGMLDLARDKCDADFRQVALPDLPSGRFDAIVAIRGVVNHLPPDALEPTLSAIETHLADDGLIVFDNSPLPAEGNDLALDDGSDDDPAYVRIARHVPLGDGRLEWQSVVFSKETCFVNTRRMTPFDDGRIDTALAEQGFDVETHDGYDRQDSRTVFVARA